MDYGLWLRSCSLRLVLIICFGSRELRWRLMLYSSFGVAVAYVHILYPIHPHVTFVHQCHQRLCVL